MTSDPVPQPGAQVPPDQVSRGPQHGGGQIATATAAAGVPIMAPIAESRIRRALEPHGVRLGGAGQASGRASTGTTGHPTEFSPHPSGTAAAEAAEGRMGRAAGAGELMAPMGAAGGKRGEDAEHRRPSYLIEMDDVFTDGRKVAPAVIGQVLPEQDH